MSFEPGGRYYMDDDNGGFFDDGGYDDGGGFDDNDPDDDSYQDDDQDGEGYQDEDDQDAQEQDEDDGSGTGGGGDDGGDGGGDGGDDGNGGGDDFNDPDDLLPPDDDALLSADDFPNASADDFEDDTGDWTADDYQESAENLFGDHPYFGDTLATQLSEAGYQPFEDANFTRGFEETAPGSSETVHLFEHDGHLSAFGVAAAAMLEYLRMRYTGIDFSNVDLSVPDTGERVPPQPLPPAFDAVQPADAVDLRKYCSPIGDQAQTSRCSAFAWTHATEMVSNYKSGETTRLSPSFTMLEFQRMQGDAQDYSYAYSGGNGTINGPDPGRVLTEQGTCRQELWPDGSEAPMTNERQLIADANRHRLDGTPWPIALEDARKALTAGCPVHVSINTGPAFSDLGRDGMVSAAEAPSGRHGRHAMLMVGYTGNFFIVKNSWGENWGDKGYCYIPKNALAASDPDLVAILVKKD